MTYNEVLDYLYSKTPIFQNLGPGAYKEGLSNTIELDNHFGNPHQHYKTIHVAGTNGKGSCSHLLASILQESGYKVGLYTSPHLIDFRERIKVNGEKISEKDVIEFVEKERSFFEPLYPSFFEVVTAMAFHYFAKVNVDVAVIEVGLGGRLDCTNIIKPELCIITNISFDHINLLGNTLAKIANEKAGIMKKDIPTVIGESKCATRKVFTDKSNEVKCPIVFAEENKQITYSKLCDNGGILFKTRLFGTIFCELGGIYQKKNVNTVLSALPYLRKTFNKLSIESIRNGFRHVKRNTGLMGRWQQLHTTPRVICDTGHNIGGFHYIVKQLSKQKYKKMRIVLGMVNDKDINAVLSILPKDAVYYFCQASVSRALSNKAIRQIAQQYSLEGESYTSVIGAYNKALEDSDKDDFIFIGGSTFVVADLLKSIKENDTNNAF
jgi:dihydrofolate synthase/folylpolyglutamate synthase